MNDFLKHYELYLKAVVNANELNKAVVFDALAAAGLTRVTVDFDGEGDSGQINDITAYTGEAPAEFPSTALTLHQAAQNRGDPRTTTVSLHDAIKILCKRLWCTDMLTVVSRGYRLGSAMMFGVFEAAA